MNQKYLIFGLQFMYSTMCTLILKVHQLCSLYEYDWLYSDKYFLQCYNLTCALHSKI